MKYILTDTLATTSANCGSEDLALAAAASRLVKVSSSLRLVEALSTTSSGGGKPTGLAKQDGIIISALVHCTSDIRTAIFFSKTAHFAWRKMEFTA